MTRRWLLITLALVLGACGKDRDPGTAVATTTTTTSTTTSTTLVPIPPGLEIGEALHARHLPALPSAGVAVLVGGTSTVVLVGADGTVLGHLDHVELAGPRLPGGGPLVLGVDGWSATIQGRRLVPLRGPAGSLPLAGGAALDVIRPMRLRAANGHVKNLPFGGLTVSTDRRWVTHQLIGADMAIAYDVATGATSTLPPSCLLAADDERGRVLACRDHLRVHLPTGADIDVGPPNGGAGHWTDVWFSPDGRTLLAQHSGECESPSAWFVDVPSGRARPTGPNGHELESSSLGWLPDGRAVVGFGPGICGTMLPTGPGVYAVNVSGDLELMYAVPGDVFGWGSVLWTTLSR